MLLSLCRTLDPVSEDDPQEALSWRNDLLSTKLDQCEEGNPFSEEKLCDRGVLPLPSRHVGSIT